MIRRMFQASCLLSAVVIGALSLGNAGPAIENYYFPIRGAQSITAIVRESSRICWDWTFVKRRDVASPNIDPFLSINGQQAGVTYIYDPKTGRPWGIVKYGVPARPEPYTIRQCSPLPPYIGPGDTVRIRQTAWYPGFIGLWQVPVPFPDVVDPGER